MARQARIHEVGDIHHTMSHGLDSLKLFESDVDYSFFLEVLDEYLTEYECHCYGFALMPNHYHLLLRPSGDKNHFSNMMRCINGKLAKYVNKKNDRKGPVFWGRYKSIPTRKMDYVRNLMVYIHANPLKAGLVSNPDALADYRWCSHSYLFQKQSPYTWLKTDYMKSQLGLEDGAMIGYLAGLSQRCSEPFNPWCRDEERERSLPALPEHARGKEAAWVASKIRDVEKARIFRVRLQKQPNILCRLIDGAKEHFGVQQIWERGGSRATRSAFNVFAHWAVGLGGYSKVLVSRMIGCDPNTVSRAVQKGKVEAAGVPFPIAL